MHKTENNYCSLSCGCGNTCTSSECCSTITNENLVNVLTNLDKEISGYSKSRIQNLLYKFPEKKDVEKNINTLVNYKKVLQRHRKSILAEETPCLCSCKVDKILEKIRKITGKDCLKKCREDVIIEDRESWIINNPQCVAAAKWEKLVYKVCFELSMDIELIKKEDLCSIVYDITQKELSCDILAAFSVYDHVCEITNDIDITSPTCTLTFDINKTKKECEINFEHLIQTTKCDLNFSKYMDLLECKLNHSIIADVYGNNLRLDIIDGKPHLITHSNSYNICDLKFTEVSSTECELLDFKPEITEYLKSYNI